MTSASRSAVRLQDCLERLQTGDETARDELLQHTHERLQRLTRKMLKGFPRVRRWAETDDVLQNALVRLLRALHAVPLASVRDFFNLSTELIRRELLDLARHYYGPQGIGAKHATRGASSRASPLDDKADSSPQASTLTAWCEFHQQVSELPEDEREVVGLLYYQGLTQAEAARHLHVTVRTVQRRWQSALLKLHRILKGAWPG
jgi:RNA polymerase sigma-70 factor (ECF subfamily)